MNIDWSIFWNAFGAIGTTLGSLITAIAVVVAVIQYKQPLTKRLKITVSTSFPVYDKGLGESCLCVTLANTGVRPIIITNIYLNAGKQNLIINKIMVDFTAMDLKMEFPKELLPESSAEIHIPYPDLSKSIAMLLARGEIPANQNLKILATDTTSVKYFCKTELTPKRIVQIGGNEND